MSKIEIDNCVYYIHPIYDLYASDENGNIIYIVKHTPYKGIKHYDGYMTCGVRKYGRKNHKGCKVHRFVWECFNGFVPHGKIIDHINDIRDDNRLCNLQLMTQQQNNFAAENHQNEKCVKATNCDTNEVPHYNGTFVVEKYLGVHAGTVKMICDRDKYRKTSTSKNDGCKYKFEYVKKNDMPDNYNKKCK